MDTRCYRVNIIGFILIYYINNVNYVNFANNELYLNKSTKPNIKGILRCARETPNDTFLLLQMHNHYL